MRTNEKANILAFLLLWNSQFLFFTYHLYNSRWILRVFFILVSADLSQVWTFKCHRNYNDSCHWFFHKKLTFHSFIVSQVLITSLIIMSVHTSLWLPIFCHDMTQAILWIWLLVLDENKIWKENTWVCLKEIIPSSNDKHHHFCLGTSLGRARGILDSLLSIWLSFIRL